MDGSELRRLPQVDRLIEALGTGEPHPLKAAAARQAIGEAREALRAGGAAPTLEDLAAAASRLLEEGRRRRVLPVVNATGVLLHTNLGRAPLGRRQLDAVEAVSTGYSNLEFDLRAGKRGSRYDHARDLLTTLTGAEAIGPQTAAIMKVHPSNYEVVGFTAAVAARDLAELAHGAGEGGLPLIHDVGSGLLRRTIAGRQPPWLAAEPTVEEALAEGADVVTFSGDKLLGGPQAGLIVGRASLIARME